MPPDDGRKQNSGPATPAAALYLHVPFCLAKCRYCDFYSRPFEASAAERFVGAAASELARRAGELGTPLRSAFVGGGTPTVLPLPMLARLLRAIRPLTGPRTEFSVESNPGTVAPETAAELAGHGVNRVTVGAQSFDAGELALLGRAHTADQTAAAVAALRRAGIDNLGMDLIYGIPGQTERTWRRSVARALGTGIRHLSCYALSIEPGTPLHADRAAGRVADPGECFAEWCYRHAIEAARRAGLAHYELSNFAAPGFQCRHNLTYWRNEPYVGIGPSAASFLGGVRGTNRPDLDGYVAAVSAGDEPPRSSERLSGRAAMAEALMLGLRLIDGVGRGEFRQRYRADPVEAFGRSVGRYAAQGALVVTSDRLRLAEGAYFVSDSVLADILAEV